MLAGERVRIASLFLVAVVGACSSDDGGPPDETTGFSSIATGAARSCVLDADGAAWCWGELGLPGATTVAPAAAAVDPAQRFTQLSAYGNIVCGVAPDGIARCWGPNDQGQLGLGTIDEGSATPVIVGTSRVFASIVAGDATACGVTPSSQGLCWGDNALGQVGGDLGPTDVQSPLPLAGSLAMRQISASRDFTCGVTTGGEAYCWGSNASGQLGNGGAITGNAGDLSRVPTKVVGGHAWRAVTTGDRFACGLTMAGAAYCWGHNEARLGNGGTAASSTPVAVSGGHVFTRLDAGRDFACGIAAGDAAFCWGANAEGQLGAGATAAATPSPVPIAVAGGLAFAELSAGDGEHACGITLDRQAVYCWGTNGVGQLGTGAVGTARTPAPVAVTGL